MELKFDVFIFVKRKIDEVFQAIYSAEILSKYFTTGMAIGNLNENTDVTWDFADFPGRFPVHVTKCVINQQIIINWGDDSVKTTVEFKFENIDNSRTKVIVSEYGWSTDEKHLKSSYSNCMGWSQMLCALKAWLEYGINLLEGAYK
jgi:uncharacterized protein YndB with AHSA1/START domain